MILAAKINSVMGKDPSGKMSYKLLDRVLSATAVSLLATKGNNVEDRRIIWTTYNNLKMWFDNWTANLLELRFAKDEENPYIPEDQLSRIGNIDETCMSLDGSKGNRGGRPSVIFYDPRFPQLGKGTSKTSLTTTMIAGSTAAGEAFPPHFQFQTSAQSPDTMRLRTQMAEFFPNVRGKFGHTKEREWNTTFGMNEKGGMDAEEFEKYVMGCLVPLYPDALDVPGKRVMLKVDSGPGRLGETLLAKLRLRGMYMYPGVPNSTAVSQETDRNYGPFKTQFWKNLDELTQSRIENHIPVSFPPWLVGLVVFGGIDPDSPIDFKLEVDAYDFGFSQEKCLGAWRAIGAAPISRACLDDPKVRRELGDGDDAHDLLLVQLQDANDYATHMLSRYGYAGSVLKNKINVVNES